ncbi:MAG: hypothetical protein GY821_06215 [Gammaproteobacteria bacterium]|nr:hypothetical protein [Gammaproteobacteria bacterium]
MALSSQSYSEIKEQIVHAGNNNKPRFISLGDSTWDNKEWVPKGQCIESHLTQGLIGYEIHNLTMDGFVIPDLFDGHYRDKVLSRCKQECGRHYHSMFHPLRELRKVHEMRPLTENDRIVVSIGGNHIREILKSLSKKIMRRDRNGANKQLRDTIKELAQQYIKLLEHLRFYYPDVKITLQLQYLVDLNNDNYYKIYELFNLLNPNIPPLETFYKILEGFYPPVFGIV